MAVGSLLFVLFMTCFANQSISASVSVQTDLHKRSVDSASPETEKYKRVARAQLGKMHFSYDRKPLTRLTISCRNNAYKTILSDFPFAEVRWEHNGKNFQLQPSRMTASMSTLTIQNLIPDDSGVYHCQMALSPTKRIVVAVFSIVVGNKTKHIDAGGSLTINCHGNELGKIFKNSTRVWADPKGNKHFKKSASDLTADVISPEFKTIAGLWVCLVDNLDTGRVWKTARIKVIVDPPAGLMTRVRTYAKNNRVEAMGVLLAGTFVFVLIVNGLTKIVEWKQKKFKSELDDIRNVLGINEETLTVEQRPLLLGSTDDASTSGSSSSDDS